MARRHADILEEIGAEGIYQRYFEKGNITKALQSFQEEAGRPTGITIAAFYKWLDADETGARRREWERVKEARGMSLLESALDDADEATPENYNAQRLKADTKIKVGSRLNRRELGQNSGGTTVNVTIGGMMSELWERLDEADYEVVDEND